MTEFTAKKKWGIEKYYFQQKRGSSEGVNAQGESLATFDLFAEPPRAGAKNAIERWMVDLPETVDMEMSSAKGLSVGFVL